MDKRLYIQNLLLNKRAIQIPSKHFPVYKKSFVQFKTPFITSEKYSEDSFKTAIENMNENDSSQSELAVAWESEDVSKETRKSSDQSSANGRLK